MSNLKEYIFSRLLNYIYIMYVYSSVLTVVFCIPMMNVKEKQFKMFLLFYQ